MKCFLGENSYQKFRESFVKTSDKQKEFLMNSLRLLYERFFHESNHKEFLWTTLSNIECPIGADSLSINKEFFTEIFFAKLITQETF